MKNPPDVPVSAQRLARRWVIKRALVGGIVAFVPLRFWLSTREPVVIFAPVSLPNPNAFDVILQACKELAQSEKIAEAVPPAATPPQNAVPISLTDKRILLKANTLALRTFREGLSLPYCEPSVRDEDSFPPYRQFRAMAKLLVLESDVYFAQGETQRGVQSCLDAVQLGQVMARGGTLISRLVALACQAIGRRPLWKHLDSLNAASAKAGARRMEAILSVYVPLAETWEMEKQFIQASYLKSFRDINEMAQGFAEDAIFEQAGTQLPRTNPDAVGPPSWYQKLCVYRMYAVWGKQGLMDNMTAHMDALIRESRKPFAQARDPQPPSDPLTIQVAPTFSPALLQDARSRTQNVLLCAAFALQAYRAEHSGTYPISLADLVKGGYLSRVPADPFSSDGTTLLRYRRDSPTEMVLWSVGPDGKDDNSAPIHDATKTGNARYFVSENSRGDIVAGTNIF